MVQALKRSSRPDFDQVYQAQEEPLTQEYNQLSLSETKLAEVIFFGKIAAFAITTVLVCFILLSQGFSSFWALVLALSASSAIITAGRYVTNIIFEP